MIVNSIIYDCIMKRIKLCVLVGVILASTFFVLESCGIRKVDKSTVSHSEEGKVEKYEQSAVLEQESLSVDSKTQQWYELANEYYIVADSIGVSSDGSVAAKGNASYVGRAEVKGGSDNSTSANKEIERSTNTESQVDSTFKESSKEKLVNKEAPIGSSFLLHIGLGMIILSALMMLVRGLIRKYDKK